MFIIFAGFKDRKSKQEEEEVVSKVWDWADCAGCWGFCESAHELNGWFSEDTTLLSSKTFKFFDDLTNCWGKETMDYLRKGSWRIKKKRDSLMIYSITVNLFCSYKWAQKKDVWVSCVLHCKDFKIPQLQCNFSYTNHVVVQNIYIYTSRLGGGSMKGQTGANY